MFSYPIEFKEFAVAMNGDIIPYENSTPMPDGYYKPSVWLTEKQFRAVKIAQEKRTPFHHYKVYNASVCKVSPTKSGEGEGLSLNAPVQIEDEDEEETYAFSINRTLIPFGYSTPVPSELYIPPIRMAKRHYNAIKALEEQEEL